MSTSSRTQSPAAATKRKQNLFAILDALNELSQDEDSKARSAHDNLIFENDMDVPSVDERLQAAGAESFNNFHKRINNLDREIHNCTIASRQLGGSVSILSSAFHLRKRLARILFIFRENAADLFPRKVSRQPHEAYVNDPFDDPSRDHLGDKLDPERFPEQIEQFANDVTAFLKSLNELPEFSDGTMNSSIRSFVGDLKYWASSLKVYRSQFRYPAVQRYIHDLMTDMGEHLESVSSTLPIFTEHGIPNIRAAQQHGASNVLNLSTVATLLSAVTATTLQFSFDKTGDPLADAVNAFWLSSLVFSIASAVNSVLGLTWQQAAYRSPERRVPWWILFWIKRSPLVFLVFSIACFSLGLVLFAYSTRQNRITSTLTAIFTAFTSLGLTAVSAWFASERHIYNRYKGQILLSDVLKDGTAIFYRLPVVALASLGLEWMRAQIGNAVGFLERVLSRSIIKSGRGLNNKDVEEHHDISDTLPFAHIPETISTTRHRPFYASKSAFPFDIKLSTVDLSDTLSDGRGNSIELENSHFSQPSKGRFASAVRSMMMLKSASSAVASSSRAFEPRRQRAKSDSSTRATINPTERKTAADLATAISGSRVAALIPDLKSLEPIHDLAAHQALIRHLQFSPDGNFLATSSWDRTASIFCVGKTFTLHRVLAHPQGFVDQVAWSPTGNLLLTKFNRSIKIWTEDGVCKKTIDRHRSLQSLFWAPKGEAFLSIEGSFIIKLDLHGKVLDTYYFHKMILLDAAMTPDGTHLLGVGPLILPSSGIHPNKSRGEKRLVVYNVDKKQIESQIPVLSDVRDITIARNGLEVLVSYENKANPQLWRLVMAKNRDDNTIVTSMLTLRHTFMPKVLVDFVGPSYFGGKDDQLVVCADKAGDIYIWDRVSAALLHHIQAQQFGGDMTCIAWNSAAEHPFMFGTGSHDGAVRIWSTPRSPYVSPQDDSRKDPSSSRRQEKAKQQENTSSPFDSDLDPEKYSPINDAQNHTLSAATGFPRKRAVSFAVPELAEYCRDDVSS